jgi:hypothetical protein
MDNAVHVQIQIIKLTIRIGFCIVGGQFHPVNHNGILFDNLRYDLGIFARQPSEKGWNTVVRNGRERDCEE